MKYIQVIDGKIEGQPRDLPKNAHNVSNFYLLSPERLIEYGWYPVRLVENSNKINTTKFVGYSFVIEGNEVVQYENIREKTEEELQEDLENQWSKIRFDRNRLLLISDWTQIPDSPLSSEKKQEWQLYRESLRNITTQTDPFNISWPLKPE